VLLNLIVNAMDSMSAAADGPRKLTVESAKEGHGVRLSVRDNGAGLDAAAMDHLFDPFYSTKAGGMGMGLAISRAIIELHGGRIWAMPNVPRGAVFQFTLPSAAAS
jgi:signal transduction histidine kinase